MSANLNAVIREKLGSRSARKLRLQGRIPASIQGEGKDSVNLSLDQDEFLAARRAHEHLFDIEFSSGAEAETALIRELHWNYFTESILHVEFRRVIRGQETTAEVELEFVGHPKGGLLNHLITHIAIKAIPSLIPDSIEIKVDALDIGGVIHASDLVLSKGLSIDVAPDTVIAMVIAPKAEVEATEEGEEGEESPEPETEG